MGILQDFISEAKNLSRLLEDINQDAINHNTRLKENDPRRVIEVDPIYLDGLFVAFDNVTPEFLINRFIIYTHEHWDLIEKRDEEFISQRFDTIFGDVSKIKNIDFDKFLKSNLTEEDRKDIWEHLNVMKNLANEWALTEKGGKLLVLEAERVMNICSDDFYEKMSKFSHQVILENVTFYPEDE